MRILITGCAGFIGFHVCNVLLAEKKNKVLGIDNLNKFYDRNLKLSRLNILKNKKNFFFKKIDLRKKEKLQNFFDNHKPKIILNLAAQAGVRYSIEHPEEYIDNNLVGFFNLIDLARNNKVKHFIYASTSSVYGDSKKFPTKEKENTNNPLSIYAATKKCNEIIAYSFSNIYKLPTTGLRFFTVYGPYGRPDMSLFKFCKNILENTKINLYNSGRHYRDFTYIDDLVRMISKLLKSPSRKKIPYQIYNLGSSRTVFLKSFVKLIEDEIGKRAIIKNLNKQKGDVTKTYSSISKYNKRFKKFNKTSIKKGVKEFVKWYKEYYKLN